MSVGRQFVIDCHGGIGSLFSEESFLDTLFKRKGDLVGLGLTTVHNPRCDKDILAGAMDLDRRFVVWLVILVKGSSRCRHVELDEFLDRFVVISKESSTMIFDYRFNRPMDVPLGDSLSHVENITRCMHRLT